MGKQWKQWQTLFSWAPELIHLLTQYLFPFTVISPTSLAIRKQHFILLLWVPFFRSHVCEIMLWVTLKGRNTRRAEVEGVAKSLTRVSSWVTEQHQQLFWWWDIDLLFIYSTKQNTDTPGFGSRAEWWIIFYLASCIIQGDTKYHL